MIYKILIFVSLASVILYFAFAGTTGNNDSSKALAGTFTTQSGTKNENSVDDVNLVKPAENNQKFEGVIVDYKNFPLNNEDNDFWSSRIKTGKPDVKAVDDEDLKLKVLNLKSNLASYMFQTEVKDLDLQTHGMVNWKWKVKQHPKGGDVRDKKVDDQAIQVILAFEGRYALTYIWDPTAPVGFSKDASIPFIVSNKVIVLESGDKNLATWQEIKRDVKADFKALYGKEAPKLRGVAFQINSQYTKSFCESFIGPVTFTKQ